MISESTPHADSPSGWPNVSLRDLGSARAEHGRSRGVQWGWAVVDHLVFRSWWLPAPLRPVILRRFGARVGTGVAIGSRVRVRWPWKLTIGDDCRIEDDVELVNSEFVVLGDDVLLGREVLISTDGPARASALPFTDAPVRIGSGAWVGMRAIVCAGAVIAPDARVPAASTVLSADPG